MNPVVPTVTCMEFLVLYKLTDAPKVGFNSNGSLTDILPAENCYFLSTYFRTDVNTNSHQLKYRNKSHSHYVFYLIE